MSINPLLLSISPPHLEEQFWAQPHVAQQLLNIDRFAFIVSTLNIYSGWNSARMVRSVPALAAVMAGLCPLFLVLSVAQQLAMQRKPSWYNQHRESILLATRIVRGGWMVVMMCILREADILNGFLARRLAAGVSPQLVALQTLMLFTLILLGQCLYWPLHFRRALPLQAAYVFASLAAMRGIKCVLQGPGIEAGARSLCHKVAKTVNCLTALLADGQLNCFMPVKLAVPHVGYETTAQRDACGAISHSSSSGSSGSSSGDGCVLGNLCGPRSSEEVLFFWLVSFGLLLPLYIMYLRELSFKQRFLRALRSSQLQQQQQQQQAAQGADTAAAVATVNGQQRHGHLTGDVLHLRPLLHFVAGGIMLMVGATLSELLLLALPPPVCD